VKRSDRDSNLRPIGCKSDAVTTVVGALQIHYGDDDDDGNDDDDDEQNTKCL